MDIESKPYLLSVMKEVVLSNANRIEWYCHLCTQHCGQISERNKMGDKNLIIRQVPNGYRIGDSLKKSTSS